jgi:hypothetical protein
MRTIKAPGAFPDADKINASKVDADNEDAVLELCKEVIGKGSETAIKSYIQTHEKRLAMLKINHFTIEGDVELKATVTDKTQERRELIIDFIKYVNLHSPATPASELESFVGDFFDGWKWKGDNEMAPKG